MAVITNPGITSPRDFAPDINIGPKTALAAFYILVGVVAMAIAIPAALMTADASMFEECFAAAEICAAQ